MGRSETPSRSGTTRGGVKGWAMGWHILNPRVALKYRNLCFIKMKNCNLFRGGGERFRSVPRAPTPGTGGGGGGGIKAET